MYKPSTSSVAGLEHGLKPDGSNSSVDPRLKVSDKDKDREWAIACMDAAIQEGSYFSSHRETMKEYLNAAEGTIDNSLYGHVLNPYNTENDKLTRFPATLRNYDILEPVIRMLMGELSERPSTVQVVATNTFENNSHINEDFAFLRSIAAQHFINTLNQFIPTDVESQEVPPLEQALEEMGKNHKNARIKYGQEALNYIRTDKRLLDKFQKAFYYFLVTGAVCLHIRNEHNEVEVEVVNPMEIIPSGIGLHDNFEDAESIVRFTDISLSSAIDRWYDELSSDDIEDLQKESGIEFNGAYTWFSSTRDTGATNSRPSDFYNDGQGYIPLRHIVWKCLSDRHILHYKEGERTLKMVVDASYTLDEEHGDVSIEKFWVNELWEGYQLADSVYVGIGLCDVQRTKMNNPSFCKNTYVGKFAGYTRNKLYSVIGMGIPYQILYNIFHYRFELTMARNKDKIMTMPLGLIPKKPGWNEDKFMYHVSSTGVAFVDETNPNAAAAFQAIKVLDLGLGQYAAQMFEFMQAIKDEWWDVVGLNRQRYGATNSSDGKGVNEQAIFRSALVTREIFRQFEGVQEQVYEACLDVAKIAYKDGKKGMYIGSDGLPAFYELQPADVSNFLESEYGIFVRNKDVEKQKLEQLRALAQPFAQNGTMPSIIAQIIDAENFTRVKELLEKGEQIQGQLAQASAQAEQAAVQADLEGKLQLEQVKGQNMERVALIQANSTLQAAEISANAKLADTSLRNESTPISVSTGRSNAPSGLDYIKHNTEARQKDKELRIKEQEVANKLKIAKENKNKYDSKK